MIKIHDKTGLKYLCKTTKKDYLSYKGSGKYWKEHLKKHGRDVSSIILYQSENIIDFSDKCLYYSKLYNIVDCPTFANLILENGLDGGDRYSNLPNKQLIRAKSKMSKAALKRSGKWTNEHRNNISISRLNLSEDKKQKRKLLIQEAYSTGKHSELFERYSKERIGKNNPAAKAVIINGKEYGSISESIIDLNLTRAVITRRLKSSLEKWKNWKFK